MAVWSTPIGRVLWRPDGQESFVEINAIAQTIHVVHEPGTTASEDDLYKWTYFVEDGELRKRFVTTDDAGSQTRISTTIAGLELLSGDVAQRWEQTARELLLARKLGHQVQAVRQQTQEELRAAGFLEALPAQCEHLVFRSVKGGWSVSAPGSSEPLWVELSYQWRGKDLHYELQQVLKRERPEVQSFKTDLKDQGEMMSYYGE